jgi:hypothetical protein
MIFPKRQAQDAAVPKLYLKLKTTLMSLLAKVTDKISIGTFWAPRPLTGLNGEPLNSLAPGIAQKIGGSPIFNSIKVRIKQNID